MRSGDAPPAIHVSRLSLDAPPFFHGASWHAVVLPRLYAYARMVRRYRACTALRAAYLCADAPARAALLLRECVFLHF